MCWDCSSSEKHRTRRKGAEKGAGKAEITLCRKNDESGNRNKDEYAVEIYFGGRMKIHCRIGPTLACSKCVFSGIHNFFSPPGMKF